MAAAEQVVLEYSVTKLRQYLTRIHVCLEKLDEERLWWRSGENANSIANLCLHLTGNVRQWILHGIGGAPDVRHRDGEFAARGSVTKAALWSELSTTVQAACAVIEQLDPGEVERTIHPQNYEVSVLEAILHVVEHFAQHTGQILFATKALTGQDLGFYRHLSGAADAPPPPAGQETP
jgi:uncharacterized damage-inducible protein DinB